MGLIASAGFAVVARGGKVLSLHKTWRGAQRAHRIAHERGHEVSIYELWHSSASKETP